MFSLAVAERRLAGLRFQWSTANSCISRSSGPWRSQRRPVGSPAETHMAGRATVFPFYGGTESSNSLSSATYDIDLLLLSSRDVLRVPARRCSHYLAESLALINLVMAEAFEDDELFRFPIGDARQDRSSNWRGRHWCRRPPRPTCFTSMVWAFVGEARITGDDKEPADTSARL